MQFILEQQARVEAQTARNGEQIARNIEAIARNSESIAKLDEKIAAVTDLVGRLAQAEIRIVERMDGQETRLQSLEAKTTALFDRMDRFIQGLEGNGHKTP